MEKITNMEHREEHMRYMQSIGTPARFFDGFDPYSFNTFWRGLVERFKWYRFMWGLRVRGFWVVNTKFRPRKFLNRIKILFSAQG